MGNDEMNEAADKVASLARDAVKNGEDPQDVYNLIFVNVKEVLAQALQSQTNP